MASNQSASNTSVTDPAEGKGKGKAADNAPQDVSMGEEDSSSDEETGAEDEVIISLRIGMIAPLKQTCTDNVHYRRRKSVRIPISTPSEAPLHLIDIIQRKKKTKTTWRK